MTPLASYRLEPFHSSDPRILDPVSPSLNFQTPLFKYKHKPSDEDRWTSIILSNPKRVISALGLYSSPGVTNEWGDTLAVSHLSSTAVLCR